MNIKDLKRVVIQGPEDGTTYALVEPKNNAVYLVMADTLEDALKRVPHNQYTVSQDKAILVPGSWEYDMAFIG